MNKTILGALVAVIIIIAGVTLFKNEEKETFMQEEVMMTTDESMMEKQEDVMEEIDTMMEKEGAMMTDANETTMTTSGSYEAYAPEKIAKAADGDVVLFFHASWCPTCRAADSDIQKNLKSIPAGLTILKVDYDNSTELKKKYGVTYQHVFVQVDAEGNQIAKWQGSRTLDAIVSEVK